jgi:hypothetical protein
MAEDIKAIIHEVCDTQPLTDRPLVGALSDKVQVIGRDAARLGLPDELVEQLLIQPVENRRLLVHDLLGHGPSHFHHTHQLQPHHLQGLHRRPYRPHRGRRSTQGVPPVQCRHALCLAFRQAKCSRRAERDTFSRRVRYQGGKEVRVDGVSAGRWRTVGARNLAVAMTVRGRHC